MIEALEWRKQDEDNKFTLFAYDGNEWIPVPFSVYSDYKEE